MTNLDRFSAKVRAPYKPERFSSSSETPDIDCVFVVDTTSSMYLWIDAAKQKIANVAREARRRGINVRLGLVEYRDHCDAYVSKSHGLMHAQRFDDILKSLKVSGGGDIPEAVLDGVNTSLKLPWQAKDKILWVVGDAPGHGYSITSKDSHPQGCPCGLNIPLVASWVKSYKIEVHCTALSMERETCVFMEILAQACGGTSYKDEIPTLAVSRMEQLLEKKVLALKEGERK